MLAFSSTSAKEHSPQVNSTQNLDHIFNKPYTITILAKCRATQRIYIRNLWQKPLGRVTSPSKNCQQIASVAFYDPAGQRLKHAIVMGSWPPLGLSAWAVNMWKIRKRLRGGNNWLCDSWDQHVYRDRSPGADNSWYVVCCKTLITESAQYPTSQHSKLNNEPVSILPIVQSC